MSFIKRHPIITIFTFLLTIGFVFVGWQFYKGQQLAIKYTAEAQKTVKDQTSAQSKQGQDYSSQLPAQPSSQSPAQSPSLAQPTVISGTETASSIVGSPATTPSSHSTGNPSVLNYKEHMAQTYQKTLQEMKNVKANTLALQGRKLSLSSYKQTILKSQAAFSSAEAFVKANPPTDPKLLEPYQEFFAGIRLAKQSMDVVLSGISSLSPSNLYAAREMGGNALHQVSEAYSHF